MERRCKLLGVVDWAVDAKVVEVVLESLTFIDSIIYVGDIYLVQNICQ